MNDEQLLRYSRHVLLDPIGIEGQEKILDARVLIVGVGGLGSPAALYLASAGVGHITLADDDTVDLTNLQRQILHTQERIGQSKVLSGRSALNSLNPEVRVYPIGQRLVGAALEKLVSEADVVLDCCDNFATRYAVNRACVQHKKPLVSGAALRFSGQLSVFDARQDNTPCYHCLFPENEAAAEESEEVRCAVMGVFAPLTGIMGSLQAAEALKLIAQFGTPAVGRLWLFDALTTEWRCVNFRQDPNCAVCRGAGLL
ncbi:MAG: molybdopterin-synthase adenylyltransferase MoeB [Pseudomonadota bacterium]